MSVRCCVAICLCEKKREREKGNGGSRSSSILFGCCVFPLSLTLCDVFYFSSSYRSSRALFFFFFFYLLFSRFFLLDFVYVAVARCDTHYGKRYICCTIAIYIRFEQNLWKHTEWVPCTHYLLANVQNIHNNVVYTYDFKQLKFVFCLARSLSSPTSSSYFFYFCGRLLPLAVVIIIRGEWQSETERNGSKRDGLKNKSASMRKYAITEWLCAQTHTLGNIYVYAYTQARKLTNFDSVFQSSVLCVLVNLAILRIYIYFYTYGLCVVSPSRTHSPSLRCCRCADVHLFWRCEVMVCHGFKT